MLGDVVQFRCNVHLELFDKDGNLIEERFGHNMLVTTGLTHIADQLAASPSETSMNHMGVGTGGSAVVPGDTALGAEVGTATITSRTHTGAVVTYVASFAAGTGTGALVEAGIFNAAEVMLCRLVYAVINKGASDTLQITWTVTAGDDGV